VLKVLQQEHKELRVLKEERVLKELRVQQLELKEL
jgi:hypothetical protein